MDVEKISKIHVFVSIEELLDIGLHLQLYVSWLTYRLEKLKFLIIDDDISAEYIILIVTDELKIIVHFYLNQIVHYSVVLWQLFLRSNLHLNRCLTIVGHIELEIFFLVGREHEHE